MPRLFFISRPRPMLSPVFRHGKLYWLSFLYLFMPLCCCGPCGDYQEKRVLGKDLRNRFCPLLVYCCLPLLFLFPFEEGLRCRPWMWARFISAIVWRLITPLSIRYSVWCRHCPNRKTFHLSIVFSNRKRPMLFLNLYVAGGLRYILPTACNGWKLARMCCWSFLKVFRE